MKLIIHPLFIIFGIYFAIIGKVFSFLIFTFTAVIHEIGHYLVSAKLGYKLNRIVLMPYGAIISGEVENIKYKDTCLIALGGPIINVIIGFFVTALWWFFPESYAYTQLIAIANFSLAIINLLPAYPLDGGRFTLATLSLLIGNKKALKIVKILGVVLGVILFGVFVYSCFIGVNFTILFFSLFIILGAVDSSEKNRYVTLYDKFNIQSLKNPKIIKRVAIDGNSIIKSLFNIVDGNYYYEIEVFLNGERVEILEGEELFKILSCGDIYSPIISKIE